MSLNVKNGTRRGTKHELTPFLSAFVRAKGLQA